MRDRGGRIFAQLWHAGRAPHVSLQEDGTPGRVQASTPRALRTNEIARVATDFADAASNADDAGFHGVELHAATEYLFEQFLNAEVTTARIVTVRVTSPIASDSPSRCSTP